MSQHLLDKIHLDDVLAKFNIRGRYHVVSTVWLTLGIAFDAMWYCDYVLIAEEIKYSCANNNLTFNSTSIGGTRLFINAENTTTANCKDSMPCAEWIYEDPNSFVAEFQLACQEWKRTLVGTANVSGYMFGVPIVGLLSDRFGRRTMVIMTGITGVVCGLAKSFASMYWVYIAIEFLEASLGDPYLPLYVLGLEMVATDSRATYMATCSMGLVIGGIMFPLIKWLVPYWRTCLRVMYTPGLVFMLFVYLLDESPRWLLTKGKLSTVVKNINKAAKLNKIEIEENLTKLSYENDLGANFKTAIADTFKSKTLLKRLFVCIIWWVSCVFVSHGLIVNSVLLGGNKYLNFALSLVIRLPSNIIAAYILNKFNRKGPLILCFMACAVICVGQPFIPKNIHWLVVAMYMTSKLISGVAFTNLYIFTPELFPTYTRPSMQALCSSAGRIGGILSTQIPLLRVYWSGLPIVLFGATSLVAAVVTALVPDTGKTSLPDTVPQAEALDDLATRTPLEDRTENHKE